MLDGQATERLAQDRVQIAAEERVRAVMGEDDVRVLRGHLGDEIRTVLAVDQRTHLAGHAQQREVRQVVRAIAAPRDAEVDSGKTRRPGAFEELTGLGDDQRDGARIVLNLAEMGASTLDVFVAGRADWIAQNRSITESFSSALRDGIRLLDREPGLAVRAQARFAGLSPEMSAAVTVGTYIDTPLPDQLPFRIELMGSAHLIGHSIAAESLIAR